MSEPAFHLYLWRHRLLLFGPAFDAGLHRHHAAQLSVALSGSLHVRGASGAAWREATAFYVPPDMPHEFEAGGPSLMLYLDPEGVECERACGTHGHGGVSVLARPDLPPADLLGLARGDVGAAEATVASLLGQPDRHVLPRDVDPRIGRALRWIHGHLDESVSLPRVADAAHVSESWLSHQFADVIGVPLRRYVLWRRLRLAIESALQGATLTEAAHDAGLSDSAHLTRAFRESFGVAPSLLFARRDAISAVFID